MRPISPSRILTYNFCKRSYELQYDLRIPSAPHPKAEEGTQIHNACEVAQKRQELPQLIEPLAANYDRTIEELCITPGALVEASLNGVIDGVPITGRLDLLDLDAGIVLDWKSSARESKNFAVQGWIYKKLVECVYNFTPDIWVSYLRIEVLHHMDADELESGKKTFYKFINRNTSRKAVNRYNINDGRCRACGYRFICNLKDKDLKRLGR